MIPPKQTMEITKGCLGGVFMVGNHIFRNSVQRLHGELVFCGTRRSSCPRILASGHNHVKPGQKSGAAGMGIVVSGS